MKVMLSDESVNECTTNESGTIFRVTCEDVEEEGRFYLYRLREGFTYPLNYTQKDDNYTFINEEIKDAWQNAQNDGFNLFSFATKNTILEELAKDSNNIYVVNGFKYFKSNIIKEDEESTQEETTYGYGNTGVFELTGGTNTYPNFRGQFFIVGETKGHCRALSPVYDFSLVEGALKIGVLYDVESVYVEGVGQTYQQRLNDNNLPLDVLGVSVANRDDLYYFKWYDHDIIFETEVLGTRVISEQGTVKHNVSNALLIELNTELKTELVDKLTNHKREVISMTNLTAVDITTLKHHCLLKEGNIGGSSNWFAIAWDLNNPLASWDDGTKGFKKTTYELHDNVSECPFNVVSPPDDEFLGWSLTKGGSLLSTPYIQDINPNNWPMALYAVWQNGTDITYYTVSFYESDENTLISRMMVQENQFATAPSGHENSEWYVVGDVTKTPIDLSTTPITSHMSLAEISQTQITHDVRWLSLMEDEEQIDEYCEPLEENKTGVTSLILMETYVNTNGYIVFNNKDTYQYRDMSGAICYFTYFKKNNTGGITISDSSYGSLIDDYGAFIYRTNSYGNWSGGYDNDWSSDLTITTVNSETVQRTLTLNGGVDEDNSLLLRGDMVSKAMRIPCDGYDGAIEISKYPYTFDSDLFFNSLKITYIEDLIGEKNVINVEGETFEDNGISCVLEEQGDTNLDNILRYNISSNNGCDYKHHVICVGDKHFTNNTFSNACVMLHFVQEYKVRNRIYYGTGFLQYKTFDDKYSVNNSSQYQYHSWFETCSSKILMNDEEPFTDYGMLAYPNGEDFEYEFVHLNRIETISTNYMWGNQSFTIVLQGGNNVKFVKKGL